MIDGSCQQFADGWVGQGDDLLDDAVLIDDDAGGPGADVVGFVDGLDSVVEGVLLEEFGGLAGIAEGECEENDGFGVICRGELIQLRHFFDAGHAGGEPKVEDDDLAAEFGQRPVFSLQVR